MYFYKIIALQHNEGHKDQSWQKRAFTSIVGERIDGYLEPTALLTKVAADSLRAVSDEVKAQGYRLKIFDAYRPQKAVDHFVRWAANVPDTLMKPYFYPDLDKSVLFEQEYIYEPFPDTYFTFPVRQLGQ